MNSVRKIILYILLLGLTQTVEAQNRESFVESLNKPNAWVDSVFKRLSRKQRIAQLFFVRAHTDKGKAYEDSIARIIHKEKVGGLVFFQGGPVRQAQLTNRYQQLAKVPLLIAMDGEWGLGMRLDSTISYPFQMTLGALQDEHLIEKMGTLIAQDFHSLGMHINFAPDVDINNNPQNPVIGFRSFGDDKLKVAAKAAAYMRGMQQAGVLVSLKHFPGHGDTDVDSHYDLPQLGFSKARLDSLELYPFKELIKQGASGVMVAHMHIPALDDTPNLPSTLSKPIVTGLLKEELGFKGLVFSDAMGMKGVVKYFPNGDADLRALLAGNDVLELSENSKRGIKLIRKAVRHKQISWSSINQRVKKVLAAKYWAGLSHPSTIGTESLIAELNRSEAKELNQQLADAAITVLTSRNGIELLDLNKKTLILALGPNTPGNFETELAAHFKSATVVTLGKQAAAAEIETVEKDLNTYEQVLVSIQDTRKRPAPSLDFNEGLLKLLDRLVTQASVISIFASPYTLINLPGLEKANTLIMGYQNSEEMQRAAIKVITQRIPSRGKLPVNINARFKNGDGL